MQTWLHEFMDRIPFLTYCAEWIDLLNLHCSVDHSPMLGPSIDELAQIDNETLEDILKNSLANDQPSETSPTSR